MSLGLRRTRKLLVFGAALALTATLSPVAPFTAQLLPTIAAASPFTIETSATAATDDACRPGPMTRIPGPPPVLEAMDALPGTLPYTGKGVLVAVIDSGVDASRPQLTDALAPGSTSLVNDGEQPDGLGDPFGHGTAVAGIIAARPELGSGVTGIAPDASLISIRVFADVGDQAEKDGVAPDADRLAAGITEAVKRGATIITVAMSDDVDSPSLRAATTDAAAAGALVVASAGNRTTTASIDDTPRYPAAYPEALAVTAVTLTGRSTDDAIHGPHVDVAAPGQQVLTTATGAGDCMYSSDAASSSFSTAYVAGTAALLAEAYPEEGPEGWAYRLKATADRPNPDRRDDLIGWGRVRPSAAIGLRPDSSTRGPASPFADTSGSGSTPPRTSVKYADSSAPNTTLLVLIGGVVGGVIAVSAIAAQLRRQRMLRSQAAENEAERAERARRESEDLVPGSPEALAAEDAINYPSFYR